MKVLKFVIIALCILGCFSKTDSRMKETATNQVMMVNKFYNVWIGDLRPYFIQHISECY